MLPAAEQITPIANGFFRALENVPLTSAIAFLHDFFIAFDIVLLAGLMYVLIELRPYKPHYVKNPRAFIPKEDKKALKDERLTSEWERIKQKAESAPPQSLTLAIIEADSFVDTILKTVLQLPGDTMADRLDRIDDGSLQTLEDLWRAHRARNDLVHTPGYSLSVSDSRRMMGHYEAFLTELGIL